LASWFRKALGGEWKSKGGKGKKKGGERPKGAKKPKKIQLTVRDHRGKSWGDLGGHWRKKKGKKSMREKATPQHFLKQQKSSNGNESKRNTIHWKEKGGRKGGEKSVSGRVPNLEKSRRHSPF